MHPLEINSLIHASLGSRVLIRLASWSLWHFDSERCARARPSWTGLLHLREWVLSRNEVTATGSADQGQGSSPDSAPTLDPPISIAGEKTRRPLTWSLGPEEPVGSRSVCAVHRLSRIRNARRSGHRPLADIPQTSLLLRWEWPDCELRAARTSETELHKNAGICRQGMDGVCAQHNVNTSIRCPSHGSVCQHGPVDGFGARFRQKSERPVGTSGD